jgi:trehalose/maltose hydrolase-like predicted phosphorylase
VNLWQISEDTFNSKKLRAQETVYTNGNGYFCSRGTFEEGYPGATPATLLYGVFDDISVGKEELANVPDWLVIKLFVNGERFRLDLGKVLEYRRILDMQKGVISRYVRWESPSGIRLSISIERFASLADEHVGCIRYSVTAEEQPGAAEKGATGGIDIDLRATLNTAMGNYDLMHWETIDQGQEDTLLWLHSQTRHSLLQLVQSMSFTTRDQGFTREVFNSDIAPSIHLRGKLAPGATLTAEKLVVMYTSRDAGDPGQNAIEQHTKLLRESGYDDLLSRNIQAWSDYWRISDILIEGDNKAQQAIRYSVYQLRISASTHDDRYSIAAKGLTGFGYRGHVFHDTEIFMLPYFTYVHPSIARNLLLYRYHLLPAARAKAKDNGYEGAQYPWESTLDGSEATPESYIHPETGELIPVLHGKIELHITASIALATWQYWYVTGDDKFMQAYGAEMLLSMAQFWASRAENHPEHGDYEINNVMGPDEWHEHVNNNAYTNYMAKWNIQTALDALNWLHITTPGKARELEHQLDLTTERLDHWRDVAARLRIPQDKHTGVFEEFDGFFQLEPLDQEKYKGRTKSYQGILGVEEVQRYRIVKQADVLMLLTVLNNKFDLQTKRANWDYYYPITDHDYGSSLTPALHTILACELGLVDLAYMLFMKGALVDLEDLRGNAAEGIHDACCGAVWQAAILGFAGLRLTDDGYTTSPFWPEGWTRIAFQCYHKGELLSIDVRKE